MRRLHPITAWKAEQKARADLIRTAKSHRKNCRNGWVPHLYNLRTTYRNNHIAYCEVRGRKREEIEKPTNGNKPDEKAIERLKHLYAWRVKRHKNKDHWW